MRYSRRTSNYPKRIVLVRHEFDDLSLSFIDIMKYVSVESKWFEKVVFMIVGIDSSSNNPHRHYNLDTLKNKLYNSIFTFISILLSLFTHFVID